MNRPKFLFYLLGFLVLGAGIVWAGTTTLTTYYPAPTGNYNQLTSNYVSIGTSTMGQALVVMPAAGNNGNVGIGTTGPLYLLDAQKTPAANSASIRFAGDDTWGQCGVGSCDGAQLFITGISNPNLHLAIGMDTTNKFGFIRATEAGVAVHNLILQPDAGSVGIGVTSPGTKLEVDGTNSSLLRIFNTAGTGTDFGMLDNIWQAHIVQNSGNLIFQIGGTSEAMRITSGGNVGIGITAPGAKLDVGTTTNCCGGTNPTLGISELTSSNNRLPWIQFHTGGYQEAYLRLNKDTRVFEMGDNQSVGVDLALLNGAGTRNVYLSPRGSSYFNGGNVGIGLTNPSYPLHISTANNLAEYLYSTNAQQTGIYMQNSNVSTWWGIGTWANGNFTVDQYGVGNRLVINSSGNVGIATTTPPNLLSLTSSGASSALQFNVSAYPTMYAARVFTQDSYNGQNGGIDLAIESQNASTWYTAASFSHGQSVAHPSLRTWYTTELATNGGNVGIGNTNPTTLLQVGNGGGTGKLTVYSQDGNYGEFEIGNPASGGEASMAFISGVAGWGASASSINGSSYVWDIGANNYGIGGNAFGIGNQAYGGVILAVQSSGNVGIGSTSPGYKLDVNGYAHFTRTMTGSINTWGQTDWGAAADIRASTSGIPFSSLNNSNSQLLLDSDDGPVAIAWHRPGIWGAEFGLDTDNQFSTQGWSAGGGYTGMKVGNFTVNGNEQINGRSGASSYLVASSFTDLVNNAPWYGLGLPNFSGSNGGAPVQLAGYGGVYLQSASGNLVLNSNGNVYASGSITAASDRRLKQNIKPLTGTLSKLDQLRGVSFEWNHLAATSMRHKEGEKGIGMIAQELQKVYPELVLEAKNGRQAYLSIDYMKFTAVLLQAVKELKKEKDKEIQELQDENEQLRSRLDALEKKVRGDK